MADFPQNIHFKISDLEDYFLFELGKISDEEFFTSVRNKFHIANTDLYLIEQAWNAMILSIPSEKVTLLKSLVKSYQIFALSNTNSSHVKAINYLLHSNYQITDIRQLFHSVYFSHEVGLDKPHREIFDYVIKNSNLSPESTLFIDDNYQNIVAGKEMGLQTIHLTDPSKLINELEKFGITA